MPTIGETGGCLLLGLIWLPRWFAGRLLCAALAECGKLVIP
jgi:hypothetical protein